MDTPNPALAPDLVITVAGHTYTIPKKWKTLNRVEQMTRIPCQAIGMQMTDALGMGIGDMAAVIWALICEDAAPKEGHPKNIEDVGNALFEEGFNAYRVPLMEFFTTALRGHAYHLKEALDAAQKEKDEAALAAKHGEAGAPGETPPGGPTS